MYSAIINDIVRTKTLCFILHIPSLQTCTLNIYRPQISIPEIYLIGGVISRISVTGFQSPRQHQTCSAAHREVTKDVTTYCT